MSEVGALQPAGSAPPEEDVALGEGEALDEVVAGAGGDDEDEDEDESPPPQPATRSVHAEPTTSAKWRMNFLS
jgi:hypothetical protein